MGEKLSEEDLNIIKNNLIDSLAMQECVKPDVIKNCPDCLKPYADINPFDSDAEEQIAQRLSIIHPDVTINHPAWVQKLIDKGLVDEDGKTVIAKNFNEVAAAIEESGIQVNNLLLRRFIDGKSGQSYSDQSIKNAVKYANTK